MYDGTKIILYNTTRNRYGSYCSERKLAIFIYSGTITQLLEGTGILELVMYSNKQTNSVALSPQAKYTDELIDRHLSTKFSANVCG
jgi:hypothetical protein